MHRLSASILVALLGLALWWLPVRAKVLEAATNQAGVAATDNTVERKNQGQSHWEPCQTGDVLAIGDRIRTGAGSSATLLLADKTVMRMAQNTELLLVDIQAGEGERLTRRFRLSSGRVWSDVTPGAPAGSVFEIQGPNAVAAVKGTTFEIGADLPEGETEVNVWEGLVECSAPEANSVPELIGAEQPFNQFRAGKGKRGQRRRFDPAQADDWQKWNLARRQLWVQTRSQLPRRIQLDRPTLEQFKQRYHSAPPRVQRRLRQGGLPPRRRPR